MPDAAFDCEGLVLVMSHGWLYQPFFPLQLQLSLCETSPQDCELAKVHTIHAATATARPHFPFRNASTDFSNKIFQNTSFILSVFLGANRLLSHRQSVKAFEHHGVCLYILFLVWLRSLISRVMRTASSRCRVFPAYLSATLALYIHHILPHYICFQFNIATCVFTFPVD